jgi:hypothetical protein
MNIETKAIIWIIILLITNISGILLVWDINEKSK